MGTGDGRTAPTAFGTWLISAYRSAGYRSASALAHSAGLEPSIVNRWIRGETVPTAANLKKVAPALRISEADLFAAAFPSEGQTLPTPPLPYEFVELLAELDKADPRDRFLLLEQVRRVTEWARYRRVR